MNTFTVKSGPVGATPVAPTGPSAGSIGARPGSFPRRETVFSFALVGVVGIAWFVLWQWGRSPYARFLSHRDLEGAGILDMVRLLPLFVVGWTVMTIAMMLPTSLPLVTLFRTMTRNRPHPGRLVGLLIAGYLVVWMSFGAVAHLGDRGVHALVDLVPWLDARPWLIGAAVLALAGAYQFSSLKYRCLEQCRSPFAFVNSHWRGQNPRADAFRLGIHHGLFCLGCCWSLMLLMFAIGAGNLGWMLVLGAIMAVEKNVRWARPMSRPLGVALLAGAVAVALTGTTLG